MLPAGLADRLHKRVSRRAAAASLQQPLYGALQLLRKLLTTVADADFKTS